MRAAAYPFALVHSVEKRQHFVWQILWNSIARPQILSDHRAHGTTRHCFRPWHVIRFIAGSRAVICHGRNQRRAPHQQLKEGADDLFLKQKKSPGFETGA